MKISKLFTRTLALSAGIITLLFGVGQQKALATISYPWGTNKIEIETTNTPLPEITNSPAITNYPSPLTNIPPVLTNAPPSTNPPPSPPILPIFLPPPPGPPPWPVPPWPYVPPYQNPEPLPPWPDIILYPYGYPGGTQVTPTDLPNPIFGPTVPGQEVLVPILDTTDFYTPIQKCPIDIHGNSRSQFWSGSGTSPNIIDGDTISITYRPVVQLITNWWSAFTVRAEIGSNTCYATAWMAPYYCRGTWTCVVSTNPASITLTNSTYYSSDCLTWRTPGIFEGNLPRGVNSVVGLTNLSIVATGITNGSTYTLEYRPNYEIGPWTNLLTVTSDSSNTDSDNIMTLNVPIGAVTQLFLRVRSADSCSEEIGYTTTTIGAYQTVPVANQFSAPDQRISTLFAGAPAGSYVVEKGVISSLTNWFDGTNWTSGTMTLPTGGSALFYNASPTAVTVTFSGIVLQGKLVSYVPANGLLSHLFPRTLNLKNTSFPAEEGDIVRKYNPGDGSWTNAFTFISGEWYPSIPVFGPGEAFAVEAAARTNTTKWVVGRGLDFTIEEPFGPEIYDHMFNSELPASSLLQSNGCFDTTYLLVHSRPGYTWDVQTATSLDDVWATEAVVDTGVSHVAVVEIPTMGRQQLFYRLKWPSEGVQAQSRMMSQSLGTQSLSKSAAVSSKAGVAQQLDELLSDVQVAEDAKSKTNYYYLTLGADGPPIPGNDQKLPETREGNIVVVDDRPLKQLNAEIEKERSAETKAKAQQRLAQPLPAWLRQRR